MLFKRQLLPLNALRVFEAVARHRTMARAADELGVTHSAVSQQIGKLEDLLDARLFDRRHKPLLPTADGQQLLGSVTHALDLLARAAGEISSGEIEGDLTVACVPGLGANWFVSVLGEFLDTYAKIDVHVVTDFWHHPIQSEDADLSIAYGSAEHPDKRVTLLGHPEFFPVCSPRLVGNRRTFRAASDLLSCSLLHDYSKETWSRWFAASGVDDAQPRRDIVFDSAHLSLQAARAGHGVALGDAATVQHDLKEGRLIRLFESSIPAIHPYYIVTPPTHRLKPAASALESWLLQRYHADVN